MTEIDSREYPLLLAQIAAECVMAESDNLGHYHTIGKLVSEFYEGRENKYGSRTIDILVDDLVKNGALSGAKDPKRMLYWTKQLYERFPELDMLHELAQNGFTTTHARYVLSVVPAAQDKVLSQMVVKGRVVSTRALQELVAKVNLKHDADMAKVALAQEELEPEPEVVVTETPKAPEPPKADTSKVAPDTTPVTKAPAVKDAKPAKDTKTTKSDGPSPLAALKAMEKALTKVVGLTADTTLAVNSATKRGFDSDIAQKNFNKVLKDAKAAATEANTVIPALLKLLADADVT